MTGEIWKDKDIQMIKMRSTVKYELKKYKKRKEELSEIEKLISSITYQKPPKNSISTSCSPNPKALENAMIKKLDLEQSCARIEQRLKKLRKINPILCTILIDNYVVGLSDIQISINCDLSYPTTYYRRKNKAIRIFYGLLLMKDEFL